MARRDYPLQIKCADEGCRELAINELHTKRSDYIRAMRVYSNRDLFCIRHRDKGSVLGPGNTRIEYHREYTAEIADKDKYPRLHDKGKKFFGNAGFIYGDGWKAWADDLDEGDTVRISVVAEVIKKDA